MRKIEQHERLVANIHDDAVFKPWVTNGQPSPVEEVVQLDDDHPMGVGFHVYRMAPGMTTTPHEHTCHEQFLVLEGDITDNDGFEYKPGDLVLICVQRPHRVVGPILGDVDRVSLQAFVEKSGPHEPLRIGA